MSYVKLWSLLSSLALISVNHAGKLVMLDLLTTDVFCSQHSLMSWRDVHIGQEQTSLQLIGNAQVNHIIAVKKSKNFNWIFIEQQIYPTILTINRLINR